MTQTPTTRASPDRAKLLVETRKVVPADIPQVAAVMARAFDDDPFANWFAAQDKRRAARIYTFMELALTKLTLRYREVYTTRAFEGAAFWNPPGTWKMNLFQQLLLTPSFARVATWRRVPKVIQGLDAVEKKHPHKPHFYLLALGVEPTLQGRSVGTQLIAPVLERCDREGIPAYLESSKERNVPMYERNGFKVTEEMVVPNGGPKLWLMWRDPK